MENCFQETPLSLQRLRQDAGLGEAPEGKLPPCSEAKRLFFPLAINRSLASAAAAGTFLHGRDG